MLGWFLLIVFGIVFFILVKNVLEYEKYWS
jgi:hypothetical protein